MFGHASTLKLKERGYSPIISSPWIRCTRGTKKLLVRSVDAAGAANTVDAANADPPAFLLGGVTAANPVDIPATAGSIRNGWAAIDAMRISACRSTDATSMSIVCICLGGDDGAATAVAAYDGLEGDTAAAKAYPGEVLATILSASVATACLGGAPIFDVPKVKLSCLSFFLLLRSDVGLYGFFITVLVLPTALSVLSGITLEKYLFV